MTLAGLQAKRIALNWPELFIAIYHHRNTAGEPMEFDISGRRWAYDLYKDDSPITVIMKSVQCGLTERLIIRMLNRCRLGDSVLYAMPTEQFRNLEVSTRINRLIQTVPFYADSAKNVDNVGNKELWDGRVRFVGSNSIVNFIGFAAQWLLVDELDDCDQNNIKYGLDRLQGYAKKRKGQRGELYLSNPSLSGYGIHLKYAGNEKVIGSDMKEWHIRCDHCNEIQPLDWYKNFVRQTEDNLYVLKDASFSSINHPLTKADGLPRAVCRKCQKPIDRLGDGRWIAEYPDREISGYHISQLFTDQTTTIEMWNHFLAGLMNQSEMQHFTNSRLGLPFSGGDNNLTFADLDKLKAEYRMPNSANGCIAGIDVGKVFNTVVWHLQEGKARTLFIGALPSPESVVDTLQRFGVYKYAIDAKPETHLARKVCELLPGGVMIWIMGEGAKGTQAPKADEINVNRTEFLDLMVANHHSGLIELPLDWSTADNGDYLSQMTAPVRVIREQKINGVLRPVYVWDNAGKADHYFFASAMVNKLAQMMGFGDISYEMVWV